MKIEPFDPEWEQMREDRIARRQASDAALTAMLNKRQENMKAFNPEKDTLLISSDKKSLTYRGFDLTVRVEKYKVAGPVHVVMVLLPNHDDGSTTTVVMRDQNRAAAMRRIKDTIDQYYRECDKRDIAEGLRAVFGRTYDVNTHSMPLTDEEKAYLDEEFPPPGSVTEDRLKRGIAQLDAGQGVERELIEDAVTLSDEERAGYSEGRF